MNDIPSVFTATDHKSTFVHRESVDKVCLVDADFLKYYVVKDVYDYIQKGKDPIEQYGLDYLGHFVFKRIDELIVSRFDAKAYVFLFSASSKKTFRYALAVEKEYKGNRKVSDDYMYDRKFQDMAEVVSVVKEKYQSFVKPDLEADDLISVLQTENTFIYSQDKDLRTVPGSHWDIKTNRLIEVDPQDALKFLMYQMCAGDSADNIPGFPGMGPAKTSKFMQDSKGITSLPSEVFLLYMKEFGINEGIDRFCENWMLLKMRPARGTYFLSKLETEINIVKQLSELK